jgi:hypothetical protein
VVDTGIKFHAINQKRKKQAEERKQAYLDAVRADPGARQADLLAKVGITRNTLQRYRREDRDFATKVTTMRAKAGALSQYTIDHFNMPIAEDFEGSFVEKRKHFFGFDTPWFQLRTVEAYANAGPGDIVLVLMPPEHGKTSLSEDDLTLEIGENPQTSRITCISEGQQMARKISSRIQRRLSDNGPHPDFVLQYGPFEPQGGEGPMRQSWGVDAWSVYQSKVSDERDYTFATGGWKSAIAGTRATRLHVDDIQSKRSLNQTADMWDLFRQDMLSRPGETGRTTLNGTRVGPNDFYARMDDEFYREDFYTKIEFPAIVMNQATGEPEPLWERDEETKTGYTMEMLDRLRKKVGEEAWWRNYMQKPRSNELEVFSEDGIERCLNKYRSFTHGRDQIPDIENGEVWLGIDPSIGGINVICAVHPARDKLMLLEMQEDRDLPRNSAIADKAEDMIRRLQGRGWRPTMIVIEAMAFQKGLINDEAFTALRDKYGLRIESHMTGYNKYDENIGVPSMASSIESGRMDLPYLNETDRFITDGLTAQFRAWKPVRDRTTGKLKFQRGTQLRQDQLMALWFTWIWWQETVSGVGLIADASQGFQRQGLPFAPTPSGLLVPN